MRPLRLELRGLTRFAEPVSLDLSACSGLVAVVGPNGAGKSTLMSCLLPAALYREIPHWGNAGIGTCCSGPAVIDLTLEHAGSTWRALHQLDPTANGGRGRAEAVLFRDGVPLTGGRLTDFDLAVAEHFPARDPILASVFAAQGGQGSFASLGPKERRDLLAQILGLDELQALAARATAARKTLEVVAFELTGQHEQALRRVSELDSLRRERAEAAGRADEAAAAAEQARVDEQLEAETRAAILAGGEERRRAAQELEARRARTASRVERLGLALAALEQRVLGARQAIVVADQLRQRVALRVDLAAEREVRAAEWQAARDTLASTSAALAAAVELRDRLTADAERMAARHRELGGLVNAEAELTAAREAEEAARAAVMALAPLVQPGPRPQDPAPLKRELDAVVWRAELIDRVPCEGRAMLIKFDTVEQNERRLGSSCELLQGAVSDRARAKTLRADWEAAELALFAWVAEDASFRSALATRQAAEAALAAAKALYDARERRVRRRSELLGDLGPTPDVETARIAVELAGQAAGDAAVAEGRARDNGAAVRRQLDATAGAEAALATAEATAAQLDQLVADEARAREEHVEASRELQEMPPATEPGAAPVLPAGAKERATAARATASATARQLAELDGQIAGLGDVQGKLDALQLRRVALSGELAGWLLLERGLGREGIQALEIDAAGPALSELTTELLAGLVGPRWAVQLRTIREATGAKSAREVCELLVTDGLRGGDRTVDRLSGGEQTVVEEALKLAIAVHNTRRTGLALGALFRDECDGRLSPDVALRYPEMLRVAAGLGGFGTVYFVTHRLELADQADHRLTVSEDGHVRLD